MITRSRSSLVALIVISVVALTGFGCRSPASDLQDQGQTLTVWGLWQESSHLQPVLDAFEEQTGIEVVYKKVASVASYERDLLEALAEGRGPDVFVIHHTWVDDKRRIMAPAPASIVDPRAVQEEFVDVVSTDLVRDGSVWSLPTSVDTLAMYVNRDLLNAGSIARPPRTWTEYQQMTEKLTTVTRTGTIQQSAGAIGAAGNINRAPDILQLLMLQSGLKILDPETGRADISTETGERALTFYTDFANKAKKVYTWNLQQDFSIDAFAAGTTATMFNYSYHIPTIKAKNPRLNFLIAPMPQIAGSADSSRINFAAYWPFAVSNASPSQQAAWTFVRFLTNKSSADVVNAAQGVPPARRDSVVDLQRDPEIGVFAEQALTAESWSRQDIVATDTIFNTMIDNVITGTSNITDAIRQGSDQLTQISATEQ